jgi:predicted transcriptional regulator
MIKDSLNALKIKAGVSCSEWSKLSTVPEATIRKILSGETPDPRFDTIMKLVSSVGGSMDDIIGVKKESEIETNAVLVLKEAYESRIEALRERVADLKERAASDARDKRMLAIAVVALVLVLVGILIFDIGSGVSWV